ncbi:MAG TPA: NAD+ synthase [Burkholderiales bacterium]|jgi:NAD+ synthetase|nr:NAD+ synthase [Burkholderiales bacterium]
MRIAIAQINCTVGDLSGNALRILEFAERARALGADLLLTPELSICGYPPEDLLLRDDFCAACQREVERLAARVQGIDVLVGHPHVQEGRRYNAASLLRGGRLAGTYHKRDLPNSEVFDEERYFESGSGALVFDVAGTMVGVNICQDVWGPERAFATGKPLRASPGERQAPKAARAAGAQVLVVLNASPYHLGKQRTRHEVVRGCVLEAGMPVVFCNWVGGQDELVFDGQSFVMDVRGAVTQQLRAFEEDLAVVEFRGAEPVPGPVAPELSVEAAVYKALTLGVRDYVGKNGFPGALIGLSGGIDSALTVCVAADALGPERVHAVMMPSQFTASISLEDARVIVARLGVRYSEIAIRPVFDSFLAALAPEFKDRPFDTTEENIQSRIRGTLLMALSNKFGSIVLTTGNKSEMSTGYATLYGDMAGGFDVLKDITKGMVYRLARYRNTVCEVIPERVIARPPSAELRPNQTDQDSLPPYDVLDAIVQRYVEQDRSIDEIVREGFPRADVERVVKLLHVSEYKRRQAPVGIRITPRGFGKDWRFPITNKFRGGL